MRSKKVKTKEPVTKIEAARMRKMAKAGKTIAEIAKALRRNASTVWAWTAPKGHMYRRLR